MKKRPDVIDDGTETSQLVVIEGARRGCPTDVLEYSHLKQLVSYIGKTEMVSQVGVGTVDGRRRGGRRVHIHVGRKCYGLG